MPRNLQAQNISPLEILALEYYSGGKALRVTQFLPLEGFIATLYERYVWVALAVTQIPRRRRRRRTRTRRRGGSTPARLESADKSCCVRWKFCAMGGGVGTSPRVFHQKRWPRQVAPGIFEGGVVKHPLCVSGWRTLSLLAQFWSSEDVTHYEKKKKKGQNDPIFHFHIYGLSFFPALFPLCRPRQDVTFLTGFKILSVSDFPFFEETVHNVTFNFILLTVEYLWIPYNLERFREYFMNFKNKILFLVCSCCLVVFCKRIRVPNRNSIQINIKHANAITQWLLFILWWMLLVYFIFISVTLSSFKFIVLGRTKKKFTFIQIYPVKIISITSSNSEENVGPWHRKTKTPIR